MKVLSLKERFSRELIIAIVLVVLVFAGYWRSWDAGFTNYDDPYYVTQNPDVSRGLTWEGFKNAWRDTHTSNCHPVTWISHMVDCQVFGLRARGHHFTNVLLHAANSVLLFALFRGLTGSRWRSAIVAGLFASHPLHVESVAWISERKDVLSGFFLFLTLLAYVGYVKGKFETRNSKLPPASDFGAASETNPKSEIRSEVEPQRHRGTEASQNQISGGRNPASTCVVFYLLALVLYALGLMSKSMLVTTPFVMLLLDWWPLRRGEKLPRLVLEKTPFFVLSAIACIVALNTQKGAMAGLEDTGGGARVANAGG